MKNRQIIYVSVRIDLASEHEITGEDIQDFLSETQYTFPSAAGLEVEDTTLNGLID